MRDYPYAERTLPFILDDKARVHGDRPFVLGDQSVGHRELRDRVAAFAGGLAERGVQRGNRVLMLLPNGIEALVASFGVAWLGAVLVPINTAYRGEMMRYVVDDAEAVALVVADEFLPNLLDVALHLPPVRLLVVSGGPELAEPPTTFSEVASFAAVAAGRPAPRSHLAPSDLHAIMYTSGTTGSSKGVMVSYHHSYQYANPTGTHFLADGDVVYVTLPLFHIGGLWAGVYAALLADGQAVIKHRFSVSEFWTDVDTYGVTQTTLLGVMAEFLWKQPPRVDDATHPLVRATMAPAPTNALAFAERFGFRISQGWGLTECGCVTAPAPLSEAAFDPTTCGKVRDDLFELMLVDAEDKPVARGERGEAVVRPKQPYVTMSGYWRKPEATADTWRNLWLHTGDLLVEREDGVYTFVGRTKDCIRRRGENISAHEVELAVLAHPDVQECAAIAVQTDHIEDEVKVVIALAPDATLTAGELHAFLVPRMPSFMVPRYIEVVDELPKTQTLKIKKDVLRAAGVTDADWDSQSTPSEGAHGP